MRSNKCLLSSVLKNFREAYQVSGLWKIIATYGVTSFAIIQLADIAFEALGLPEFAMQLLLALVILALPLTLILSRLFADRKAPKGLDAQDVVLSHALAVLPFTSMSSEKAVEHFSDALSDQLISACQNNLDIPVRSRNSTFVYKEQAVSIRDAARELDCSLILEGSVQSEGDKIRVIAQLIDANTDVHLWASNFDREKTNSFDLQDDIAGSISSNLKELISRPAEKNADSDLTVAKSSFLGLKNLNPWIILSVSLILITSIVFYVKNDFAQIPALNLASAILSFSILALLFAAAGLFFLLAHRKRSNIAFNKALSELEEHASNGRFFEAFTIAEQFKSMLTKSKDDIFWDQFSLNASFTLADPDYTVEWRPFNGRNIQWRRIESSSKANRLPKGNLHFRITKPGCVAQEFIRSNPSPMFGNLSLDSVTVTNEIIQDASTFKLYPAEILKESMVHVERGPIWLSLVGMNIPEPIYVQSFHIDEKPVTNRDFKAFVDAGGYSNHLMWEGISLPAGLNLESLLNRFVDRTQNKGPANWELGRPRDNELDMPVTGVSWYEASAYAKFIKKELPTVYQWIRAALPFDIGMTDMPVSMMKYSNFQQSGPNVFKEFQSPSAHGAYDMFGNVREWVRNKSDEDHVNLGGSYMDQAYTAMQVNAELGLNRNAINGFRCVFSEHEDNQQSEPIVKLSRDYSNAQPVDDEVFDALVSQFKPRSSGLQVQAEVPLTEIKNTKILKESIMTGYGERMNVVSVLPESRKDSSEKKTAIIYFPGLDNLMGTNSAEEALEGIWDVLGFIVSDCDCMLIAPSFSGVYERFDYGAVPPKEVYRQVRMDRIRKWVQETHQVIDYLTESHMTADDKIGFLGVSYGAINTMPILALTNQIKGAILMSGNLPNFYESSFADAMNYLPRIKMPLLMLNGRYDTIVSSEESLLNKRMELLGTPADKKTQIMYDAGHVQFPKHLFEKDVANWLKEIF